MLSSAAMLNLLIKPLSLLSLKTIHRLGSLLGKAMYLSMPNAKRLIAENIKQTSFVFHDSNAFIKANLEESGKAILESLAIWQNSGQQTLSWVTACNDWNLVEKAIARKKGIIFLTPHMGCFEITSIFYGAHYPITVLFRQPKRKWLRSLTVKGRSHNQVHLAPANTNGVRKLLQALKRGEAIGILPDQIPGKGEGEWAPFFGKPAYTMLLASKLAEKTGATVIMAYGERLPDGEGFKIHLTELPEGAIATPALLNQAIEKQIAQNPSQYLWSYPRYKVRNRLLKKQQTTN